MYLQFTSVSFTHQALVDPLLTDLSFTAPVGWTGVVGANGTGKSTLLALATGALTPDSGTIVSPGSAAVCEQRTDRQPRSRARTARASQRSSPRSSTTRCATAT